LLTEDGEFDDWLVAVVVGVDLTDTTEMELAELTSVDAVVAGVGRMDTVLGEEPEGEDRPAIVPDVVVLDEDEIGIVVLLLDEAELDGVVGVGRSVKLLADELVLDTTLLVLPNKVVEITVEVVELTVEVLELTVEVDELPTEVDELPIDTDALTSVVGVGGLVGKAAAVVEILDEEPLVELCREVEVTGSPGVVLVETVGLKEA